MAGSIDARLRKLEKKMVPIEAHPLPVLGFWKGGKWHSDDKVYDTHEEHRLDWIACGKLPAERGMFFIELTSLQPL